jgi:hypothetical protein
MKFIYLKSRFLTGGNVSWPSKGLPNPIPKVSAGRLGQEGGVCMPDEEKEKKLVGKVTHFFTNISVAVIELSDALKAGDKVSIEGATTNIEQKIDSMQIHNDPVKEAKAGDAIGVKVKDRVREGDQVYKI